MYIVKVMQVVVMIMMLMFVFVCLLAGVYSTADNALANRHSSIVCSLEPDRIDRLIENEEVLVVVNCSAGVTEAVDTHIVLMADINDTHIANITGDWPRRCYFDSTLNVSANCSFGIRGLFLGRTAVRIKYTAYNSAELPDDSVDLEATNTTAESTWMHVAVVRKDRMIDHIFLGLVTLMVIIANIGMGCKIEMPVVKEVLKRPIAPIIGFCCQYLIMPLVS